MSFSGQYLLSQFCLVLVPAILYKCCTCNVTFKVHIRTNLPSFLVHTPNFTLIFTHSIHLQCNLWTRKNTWVQFQCHLNSSVIFNERLNWCCVAPDDLVDWLLVVSWPMLTRSQHFLLAGKNDVTLLLLTCAGMLTVT